MPPMRERRWWTDEEDEVLRTRVQLQEDRNGNVENWNEVAIMLPGRTNKDCRKRWSKVQVGIRKGAWTHDEDERLQRAVEEQGFKWALISRTVRTRNADQCAKRWQHVLGPGCKHSAWTVEEDQKLLAAIDRYGNNWKQIGLSDLPDRSSHDIRNRSVALGRRRRSLILPVTTKERKNSTGELDKASTEDEIERGQAEEHDAVVMDIDQQIGSPEPSLEHANGVDFTSQYEDRKASCSAMDIFKISSSVDQMWDWADFTAHPILFDDQQLSTTPNTNLSSCPSQIEDTGLSTTVSYPQSEFTSSDDVFEHEIDFTAFDQGPVNTPHTFQNHDHRLDTTHGVGLLLPTLPSTQQTPPVAGAKGHATIVLKNVEAGIAQDIMSSVMRHNDSLVVRLHIE